MTRLSTRGAALAGMALVLTAAGLGWLGPELAAALPDQGDPMVTVAVAGATSLSETNGVRHLAMTADVTNLGSGPVQLVRLAGEVPSLSTTVDLPAGRPLPAGSVTRITLTARLDCNGGTPLRLPPLELRDDAGVTFRRAVTGSSQRFLPACTVVDSEAPNVGLRRADFTVSGDQLVLSLAPYEGQTLRLLTVTSGGLPVTATPSPVLLVPTVDQQVRLDPPSSCSADWAISGPSGQLELVLDWGPDPADPTIESDPFRVVVETGPLGADWLMRHSCREWVR